MKHDIPNPTLSKTNERLLELIKRWQLFNPSTSLTVLVCDLAQGFDPDSQRDRWPPLDLTLMDNDEFLRRLEIVVG